MPGLTRRTTKALAALMALALAAPAPDRAMKSLVPGDDLANFEVVGLAPDAVKVAGGEVHFTGKPKGYVATKGSFHDYDLEFEWAFDLPKGFKPGDRFHGNSGLMLHIQGTPKVWPRAIEVQVWHKSEFGDFFTLDGARFDPKKDDHEALARILKPPGEWNRHEISCRDGAIALKINGVEVAKGVGADPDRGKVGWMSEGDAIRFRNLRIRPRD